MYICSTKNKTVTVLYSISLYVTKHLILLLKILKYHAFWIKNELLYFYRSIINITFSEHFGYTLGQKK